MRASEFINEQIGSTLSGLAMGAGKVLGKVAGKLGKGAANVAGRLGGLETAGEKAAGSLAAKAGLGKTGQTMASVIGKGAGSYVKSKVAEPPRPGTVGTDQVNSKPVAKGDTIDSPALNQTLGGPVKVANVSGTDVEVEVPGLGPKATLKVPKSTLGVR